MSAKLKFMSVTDKDIFDLLMSSKQRLTEKTLSEMFIGRGILMSRETERVDLCRSLSQMPHDRKSIVYMIEMRETAARSEKRAFMKLNVALTPDEIDQAVNAYIHSPGITDIITTQSRRSRGAFFNLEYDEVDYSKTRLMQSQKRDAGIEITVEGGQTTIRMPAIDKAIDVVNAIRKEIEKIKLQPLQPNEISLVGLNAAQRTDFFMRLLRGLPGYNLTTVIGMKVASELPEDDISAELDIDSEGSVGQELLSKINRVAISGLNLLQTEEYQTLLKNGFFLTSIVWRAQQQANPHDMMQFEIGFKNGPEGTGFRFNAKIARRLKKSNEVTDDFIPLEENRRPAIWNMIEAASQDILSIVQGGTNNAETVR